MTGPVFLENDRAELRTIEDNDLDFIRNKFNLKETRHGLDNWTPKNLKQQKDFYEEIISSEEQVTLMICDEGDSAGIISLRFVDKRSKVGEFGLWIAPEFQKKGLGTASVKLLIEYAFEQLNLNRLQARAHEENAGSRNLWEKLGFKQEATIREAIFIDGKYVDAHWYALLRD